MDMTQANTIPKPMKRRKTFVEEVEDLFLRHGYRDWAVVVRREGTEPEKWCAAGIGDPAKDGEALAVMHFELEALQQQIMALAKDLNRKPQPKPKITEKPA